MTKKSANRRVRALLFDFGNTLAFIDYALLAREFGNLGLDVDAAALERAEYAGRAALDKIMMSPAGPRDPEQPYRHYFRAWMKAAGVPDDQVRTYGARFAQLHVESTLWRVVRPGTHDALERLKSAGFKLAIVSNADGRVEDDARRFALAPFFDVIIDSQVVGVEKPDPRIFRIALDRLGVGPDEVRYAGDIYSIDMVGAHAAGIDARLVDCLGSYSWVEHQTIRHISELHPIE
jgi:HAD superfamily hydrolase (TIGR01549 family)